MSDPLFVTPPYLYAFYAVLGGSGVSEFLGRRQYRAAPETRADARSYDALTWAVFLAVGIGGAGALLVDATTIHPERVAFWTGLGLVLFGLVVRRIAMWTLREHYSYRVAVRPDHEVVDGGLYRWVRHPAYTAGIVGYLGIGLALGNWIAVLAFGLATAAAYGYRIRVEERVLRAELGEAYERYAGRTPYRLVPGVW